LIIVVLLLKIFILKNFVLFQSMFILRIIKVFHFIFIYFLFTLYLLFILNIELELITPCILPEIEKIHGIEIKNDRYWSINFNFSKNKENHSMLKKMKYVIFVQRNAGSMDYLQVYFHFICFISTIKIK